MNKTITFLCLIFAICLSVKGQEDGTIFQNGIVVAHKTEISRDGKISDYSEKFKGFGTSSVNNIIHQIYYSEKTKEYTGYDLEFLPQSDTEKFVVKIRPLSIRMNKRIVSSAENWSFRPLPKYTNEMIVDDGDIIFIDVLENPTTKEKITDLIKITRKKREFGGYFRERNSPKPLRDFTVEDIELRLMKYQVFINNEKVAQIGGGGVGNLIWFYFPNGKSRGRFIFSIVPRIGYDFKKIGTINNEKIEFTFNGDNYKFITETPILFSNETWNLWVLFDPNYKTESTNFISGSAGDMKGVFINN